ncbi:MAG: glycosyltransferase family 2 protein [Halobacteriota archaeon]
MSAKAAYALRNSNGEAIDSASVEETPGSRDRSAPPLVSVVIPTYNRSELIREAVESVYDQTYDRIELIVVDDHSPIPVSETLTEDTPDSIASMVVLRHDENRGANAARNTGIRRATGEYVAFLDDDDRWETPKVHKQIEAFQSSGPEVGVVYTGKRSERAGKTTVETPTWSGNVLKDLLTGKNFSQFSGLMVRESAIEAAGLPDERFPCWQDREWFFRLAKHCEFEPVSEPLVVRRLDHDDRIGRNFEQKRDVAYPLFLKKHYGFAAEYGPRYRRAFLASLRTSIGQSAIHSGRYREARKYFVAAFRAYPLYRPCQLYLLATLGGKWTYKPAQVLNGLSTAVFEEV